VAVELSSVLGFASFAAASMAFVMAPAGMQHAMQPVVGSFMMMQSCPPPQGQVLQHPGMQAFSQFPQMHASMASSLSSFEVCQAVESLYRDGMKPYGRLLKKRLAELAHASGRGGAEREVSSLRAACEACPYLTVLDGEGGDWAAVLPGVPDSFVNVYCPHDCYQPELWACLAAYFSSIEGADMILPGGRYSCAQVLVQRRLACLAGYSLGQVSHIVQLAISQKKLLGYLNGNVVPYSRSLSMVKDQSAQCQRPCASTSRRNKSTAFATWDVMRPCLEQLLSTLGGQPMPLSNLKRLFRVQFNVELSETALGHAKLSECLQDPRVRDLCDVRLQGQGYTIVPAQKPVARSLISLADSLCMSPEPTTLEVEATTVENSRLLGKRGGFIQPLSLEAIDSPPSSPTAAQAQGAPASLRATPLPLTPFPQTPFPPTPSPSAAYMRSLPRLLGRVHQPPMPAFCASKDLCSAMPLWGKQPLQEAAPLVGKQSPPVWPQSQGFDGLPPAMLSTFGLSVQNTFLHAPLPPPTPLQAGARFRARSLTWDGTDRQ